MSADNITQRLYSILNMDLFDPLLEAMIDGVFVPGPRMANGHSRRTNGHSNGHANGHANGNSSNGNNSNGNGMTASFTFLPFVVAEHEMDHTWRRGPMDVDDYADDDAHSDDDKDDDDHPRHNDDEDDDDDDDNEQDGVPPFGADYYDDDDDYHNAYGGGADDNSNAHYNNDEGDDVAGEYDDEDEEEGGDNDDDGDDAEEQEDDDDDDEDNEEQEAEVGEEEEALEGEEEEEEGEGEEEGVDDYSNPHDDDEDGYEYYGTVDDDADDNEDDDDNDVDQEDELEELEEEEEEEEEDEDDEEEDEDEDDVIDDEDDDDVEGLYDHGYEYPGSIDDSVRANYGRMGYVICQNIIHRDVLHDSFSSRYFLRHLAENFFTHLKQADTPRSSALLQQLMLCLPRLVDLKYTVSKTNYTMKEALIIKVVLEMYESYYRRFGAPNYKVYHSEVMPLVLDFYQRMPDDALRIMSGQLKKVLLNLKYLTDNFTLFHTKQEYISHYTDALRKMRNLSERADPSLFIR